MNRYRPTAPRALLAVAAVAATALTLAAAVLTPIAAFETPAAGVALAENAMPHVVEITPARIEVFAVREPVLACADGRRPAV